MAHLPSPAWALSKRALDLAQSEADVFDEPDAWYSAEPLFGAYPGLGQIEMPGKLAGVHGGSGLLACSFAFAVVSASQREAKSSRRPGI
jgi:hypothetical protein